MPRWRWVRVFAILPRPVRDWRYDRIARNRYQLFGRTESCMVPAPELLRRFVFDDRGATSERADGNDRCMRSPFERLLGAELERLPAPVRRVHSLRAPLATAGRADMTAATGLLAWLTPGSRACRGRAVTSRCRSSSRPTENGGEHWERTIRRPAL